jgi:tetratricopeptide (TPR) repeat protein
MFDDPGPLGGPEGSPGDATMSVDAAPGHFDSASSPPLPATIGRYRIIRLLGEGGMGAVYEAEQDQPRRRVAIKVVKAAWASPSTLQRFELETESLGRLHHVGIAQIYEAGSAETPLGVQPFFAMELIHGEPVVQYADVHHLDTRQRLALMVQVCEAAHHAHQRGIIHRDLKPGNILVDESGQPKILDFGLARATDSDAQVTRQTDVGQLLGTLAYMSPEQVLADPLLIDTRSDVYALGIILYQLLARKFPYILPREIHDVVHTIRNVDPAPLSSVNHNYRGDIETIVAKALEKDKARRYASAADLAADIQRYLSDQPIAAKPASTLYQLQKFALRHKALVAAAGAVLAVLVLGIVASTWEAVRARRAEAVAKQESAIAQAVNEFLQKDILGQASAYNQSKPDPDLKVRAALERAAQNIHGKFEKQPEVEASIRETIGKSLHGLGLYDEARAQFEPALVIERRVLGPENPKTIATMLALGATEEAQGKFPEAEALDKQVLELSRRVLGPESPTTIQTMNRLCSVYDYEGKYAEGEAIGTQSVEISRRANGPESPDTLSAMHFLAIIYYEQGKYPEAIDLGKQALELRRRILGPEHPDTLGTLNNLAAAYGQQGDYAQEELLGNQLLEIRRRVLGPEHPDTLDTMINLALVHRYQKKYSEAESVDRQVLEIQRRSLGPEHPLTLRSMNNLAIDLLLQGNAAQAEALDQQVYEIRRRVLGPENPDTLRSVASLAYDYRSAHKYEQAAALDQKNFEVRARVLGPNNPDTLDSIKSLGFDYRGEGRLDLAIGAMRKVVELRPDDARYLNELAWFLLTAPDPAFRNPVEALGYSRRATKIQPDQGGLLNTLGLALVRNGLWEEAIATLNKAVTLDKSGDYSDFLFLAMAYQGHGDTAEAQRNFAIGSGMASKLPATDLDSRKLWAEAAKALGKPGLPSR